MIDNKKDLLEEWDYVTKKIYELLAARSGLARRLHAVSPNDPAIRGILHIPDIGTIGESARKSDLEARINKVLDDNKP